MVSELRVASGKFYSDGPVIGYLKSIVVSDHSVVGYLLENPLEQAVDLEEYALWTADDWKELIEAVGDEMALEIYRLTKDDGGHRPILSNERAVRTLHNFDIIAGAVDELRRDWEEGDE